jgi:ribosomal protein S18 acetylase RimI-like enzyme
MIEIKPILPDQWQLHKSVRCAALANAPFAYSSSLESALKRSDDDWMQITRRYADTPNSITYFAFRNELPCGISACVSDGNEVEMYAVWVDPACRRKGVGRALIEYARAWSKANGATRLRVGIFDDNHDALAFYRSTGFSDSGMTDPGLSTEVRTVLLYTMRLL